MIFTPGLQTFIIGSLTAFFWVYYFGSFKDDPETKDTLYKTFVVSFLMTLVLFAMLTYDTLDNSLNVLIDAAYFKDEETGKRYHRHPGYQGKCMTPEKLAQLMQMSQMVKENGGHDISSYIVLDGNGGQEEEHLAKVAKDSGLVVVNYKK